MNLLKCSKGHFYDGDKYASCPHCNTQLSDTMTISMPAGSPDDVTVALKQGEGESPVTMKLYADNEPVTVPRTDAGEPITQGDSGDSKDNPSYHAAMEKIQGAKPRPVPDDDGVTLNYYSQKLEEPFLAEPVVGWLVCTTGNYFGQSFNLKSGRNFVGREAQMDVCLSGEPSVSRNRHAVIIYDPVGRMFLAQAGDSRELFYVNDNVVLDHVQLKPYDVISVGKVNLIFIPCCTNEFSWDELIKEVKR